MGRLARAAVAPRVEVRDTLENPSVDLVTALVAETDGTSITSVSLTPAKALRSTAVNACVRVIAESCASLPLPIYERTGRVRSRVGNDPRWALLNSWPNPEMTAMELWETWIAHALLWGPGYIYVLYNQAGQVAELWPLRPDRTRPMRTPGGQLYYTTILDNGQPQSLAPENVLVIQSIFGLSPIKVAREALTINIAAEEYAGRFWANNARPGGIIEMPRSMENDEYDEFRRRWRAGHEGLKRSQLIGILTGGAKWTEVGISPGLAQFIETRQFGVRETARLFRVPPHMIADLEGTVSRASIEQQSIEFVVYSLRPWLVRAEQKIRQRLFNQRTDIASERYPEFLVDGLMRGDTAARYEGYAKGIQWGFLSRADVREIENLPIPDGQDLDQFLLPMNMLPSGALLPVDDQGVPLENASALGWLSLLFRNDARGAQAAGLVEKALERRRLALGE